ncbi:MAG: exodeoxyribonuclease VII small subunit [Cyanobacteriota bacterium]|jgi:exodeoxyribonuclease VII small subunit
MTAPPSDGSQLRSRSSSRSAAAAAAAASPEQLSYREAQSALELSLVELQAEDLDVERMTEVYRRACAYADRCEALLQTVEAQVLLWDPDQPDSPPQPLNP